MSEEKKWKRGDIGPDGRVFWRYGKQYRNGEQWIDADRFQQLYEKVAEVGRRYKQENRENVAERVRRTRAKKIFRKSSPKTIFDFYKSLRIPIQTFAAIFSLTPDEGQTLAELIHELSGYPMELCEQIANPPEPEPEPTPEPQPPPVILPDLF
jgi:hypothetical protein